MSDDLDVIDPSRWRDVPCTAGRVATEGDVEAGRAVFCLEGASTAIDAQLPCCAFHITPAGDEVPMVVIQGESSDMGVLFGVRYLFGGFGICPEAEVRLLPEGWPDAYEF